MPYEDLAAEIAKRIAETIRLDKEKDLQGANQSLPLIETHLSAVPLKLQALRAAKDTADPTNIRGAAADAERLLVMIVVARDALNLGISRSPENAEEMREAAERTKPVIRQLTDEIAKARAQAQRLAQLAGGVLEDLPQGAVPSSPSETRAMAMANAPTGLCDDPEMQDPDSQACPLEPALRETNRQLAKRALAEIAHNWRDAASDEQLRVRLEPLLQTAGFDPLTSLLFSIATGWLSSMIGDAMVGGVNKARNAYAGRQLGRSADTIAIAPIDLGPTPATAAPMNRPATALITGLGSKLVDAAKTHVGRRPAATDTTKLLFDRIREAAGAWSHEASLQVDQVPDPVLVALAGGLAAAPFNIAYFRERIATLVDRFKRVEQIDKVTLEHVEPLHPLWVVSATGGLRLALARRETTMVDIGGPQTGREPNETEIERPTGRWIFDSWVDRSLYEVALARDAKPTTLTEVDSRWQTPPGILPNQEDVHMFKPDTRVSSR